MSLVVAFDKRVMTMCGNGTQPRKGVGNCSITCIYVNPRKLKRSKQLEYLKMNIRYEILRRKDNNRSLAERRKLLEQWTSVYESYHLDSPGKDHRNRAEKHWRYVEEIRSLTLEIDLNGSEIQRLRAILKAGETSCGDMVFVCSVISRRPLTSSNIWM